MSVHPDELACVLHPVGAAEGTEITHACLAQQVSALRGLLHEGDRMSMPATAPDLVVLGLAASWTAGVAVVLAPAGPATVALVPPGEPGEHTAGGPRLLTFGSSVAPPRDGTTAVHGAPTAPVSGVTPSGESLVMLRSRPEGVSRHVLGADGCPAPPGTVGELWLGGPSLPRGLRHAPAATAARWWPAPGCRLLRTGDLVRRRSTDTIEIVGRAGTVQRLGERWVDRDRVTQVLAGHPAVRAAAVIIVQLGDDTRLAGWLVPDRQTLEETATDAELVRRVQKAAGLLLPEGNVPSVYGVLDELPTTSDGVLDERALHARKTEATFGVTDATPPSTRTERRLVAVFQELLDVAEVGVHANFFGLGGHSMLAARLIARVRHELGAQVPVREFFRSPTVAGLAEAMNAANVDRRSHTGERTTDSGTRRALAGFSDAEVSRLLDGMR